MQKNSQIVHQRSLQKCHPFQSQRWKNQLALEVQKLMATPSCRVELKPVPPHPDFYRFQALGQHCHNITSLSRNGDL